MGVEIMSKTFWWIAGSVVLVILLYFAYLLFWPFWGSASDSSSKTSTEVNQRDYTPKVVDAALAEKDFEIQQLKNSISVLNGQITEKDQQISDLIKNCTGKTKYLPAKSTSSNGSGNTNPVNLKSAKTDTPQTKEVEAEYLTKQNSVPKSKVQIEVNEIKYCIRLGNLFWPHLAVNQGEEFPEIVDNGVGGFDLFLLPSGTIGSSGKDYGITEDFTFWIKKSRLTSWPETPYFLNKSGIFVKGQESGEYWIAK